MEEVKKVCFKCEIPLPISQFYEHSGMSDGHLNKCKECTKKEVKKRELELRNNPDWVAKEKNRGREKYHRLGYKDLHKPTTAQKREVIRRYRQKYPEKSLATRYTEIYLTKLPGINLHHWSYNQEDWLDIVELPIAEHHFLHRFIIYDQERMKYRTLEGVLLDTKENHLQYFEECKLKHNFYEPGRLPATTYRHLRHL